MKTVQPLIVEIVEHKSGNTFQQLIFAGKDFRVLADAMPTHEALRAGKWYLIDIKHLPENMRKELTRQGLGYMLK